MATPVRVMVVDDSALYRRAITDVLSGDANIQVLTSAPNGAIALEKIPQNPPDLITLDMEMPEVDGLQTLRELKNRYPEIKTIVFSHLTEKGAELTLQALELGAIDFVTKPSSSGSLEQSLANIRRSLLPKVIEFSRAELRSRAAARPARTDIPAPTPVTRLARREVIVIGISTGGPNSLMAFFEQIPKNLHQPILIVQHMPAIFTRKLAEQLSRVGTVPAHEAVDGEPIVGGNAYIAPGDFHMEVISHSFQPHIHVFQGPQENYCRPAVDVLFRSVAEHYGKKAVGVIMTGMGKDGLEGSKVMKAAGAPIIAQDEASSVVWGMPRFIVENNMADAVAPLDTMFHAITQFII